MLRKSISQLVVLVLACWVGLRTHRSWTDAMIEDEASATNFLTKSDVKKKGSYRGVWENSVKMSALGRGEEFTKVVVTILADGGISGGAACETSTECGVEDTSATCDTSDASNKICAACATTSKYTGADCRLLKSDLGEVVKDGSNNYVVYEYDPAKWDDLVTLDFAWLSGAYLLLAIILVGIATIGDFTNFKGFEQIMAAASNLVSVTVQKSIVTAISTSIFDVLAVVLLAGSMLTFENVSASGLSASGEPGSQLLSTELIFSLAALTVISRSTRALAASAMSFTVTIFASMCIVIIVVDQWRQLPMITRMISRPQLLLLCSFEFIYVLSRLAAVQSDAALITLKALGVNMVLYITARMHANLRPLSANVAGSTRDQLSPLDEQCNFLHDDMVVYDADSRVSENWYSFSTTGECTSGGDYQNWPMLVPILLLAAYCVLVYLDDMKVISTALNKLQALYLPTSSQTESYRRIRVI